VPKRRIKKLEKKLTNKTNGLSIFCKYFRIKDAGRATFSEFNAAKVLGVISANTKINKVKTIDPITTPLSPNKFKQRTVVSEAAKIFTKLFPMRITPSNLSGLLRSLSALIAPLLFSLTKCLRRYLFRDIIAVSTPEKKAEINSKKMMLDKSIQGLKSANLINYVNSLHFFTIIGRFYLNTKLNYLEYVSQRYLW